MADESVAVKWDHHHPVLLHAIKEIYTKEIFADVRLVCEGHEHWAHKFILSACSQYFQEALVGVPHRGSITVTSSVQHKHLFSLLEFMYLGEVIVPQDELAELVSAAEVLRVRGFALPCDIIGEDNEYESRDLEIYKIIDYQTPPYEEQTSSGEHAARTQNKRKHNEEQWHQDRYTGDIEDISIKQEPLDNCDFSMELRRDPTTLANTSGEDKNFANGNFRQKGNGGSYQHQQGYSDPSQGSDGSGGDINNLLNVLIGSGQSEGRIPPPGFGKEGSSTPAAQNPIVEGGFVCPQCKKTFHWRSNLTKHLRTHTGEKPYSCNTCEYKTSYSEALKRHMRKHTGEKPYHCNRCDYRSKDYGSLKNHLRKHPAEVPNTPV